MKKKVAVVILNWNGAALLRRFLPSVCAHTNDRLADVVVVDNGSDDTSVEILNREFPQVRTLLFPRNYGFAEGYNRALDALDYEYAVLLNSDVEVTPQWIEPLLAFVEAHPDVAACQPKIRALREPEKFEYAGAAGGFIDRYGYPFCRGRLFGTLETDHGQYDDPLDIFWASGAALFVRTAVYRAVGGLDPSFFAHMEEIDLCWRIHLAGHRIAVVPQSVVYHQGGASLDASNPRKTYLNFRNNLLMPRSMPPIRERPTSTSATTCSCCTRTCPGRRGKRFCLSAGSTTRWPLHDSSCWDSYPTPGPYCGPTTTSARCASNTPATPTRTCWDDSPRRDETSPSTTFSKVKKGSEATTGHPRTLDLFPYSFLSETSSLPDAGRQ